VSRIRKHFVTRYTNGWIVEADYSQLEVFYLAHVTKDEQLRKDLLGGLDMHTVRASELFRIPERDVSKAQRRAAKSLSFMLQYGAGSKHMAKETELPEDLCKEFISNYYNRYPRVEEWQRGVFSTVKRSRKISATKTPKGEPRGLSTIQSETGRLYTFYESDSPQWMRRRGIHTSFKPTEVKNYPIQGGATGDIVPMMLGKINRWVTQNKFNDTIKLIATVHDSIVLDVEDEMLDIACYNVKRILESAPEEYERNFGVEFDLPLNVSVEYGPNWADCTRKWEK